MKKLLIVPFVLFSILAVLHFLSAVLGFWKTPGFIQFELKYAIVVLILVVICLLAEKIQSKLPFKN